VLSVSDVLSHALDDTFHDVLQKTVANSRRAWCTESKLSELVDAIMQALLLPLRILFTLDGSGGSAERTIGKLLSSAEVQQSDGGIAQ
jgi:hypothetical protein